MCPRPISAKLTEAKITWFQGHPRANCHPVWIIELLPICIFVISFWKDMSTVKFLLFCVDVGNDKAHDFLHMFNSGEMRWCFRLFQEKHERNIAPSLVLKQHLSETQQKAFLSLQRPIIFSRICDKNVTNLLRIKAQLTYCLFADQFFTQIVNHHHSSSIYLSTLRLHLLWKKGEVESVKIVGIWLEKDLGGLIEKKN